MKRLSGMDASFLYMETPSAHAHVVGTLVLDPSTSPDGFSFEKRAVGSSRSGCTCSSRSAGASCGCRST